MFIRLCPWRPSYLRCKQNPLLFCKQLMKEVQEGGCVHMNCTYIEQKHKQHPYECAFLFLDGPIRRSFVCIYIIIFAHHCKSRPELEISLQSTKSHYTAEHVDAAQFFNIKKHTSLTRLLIKTRVFNEERRSVRTNCCVISIFWACWSTTFNPIIC